MSEKSPIVRSDRPPQAPSKRACAKCRIGFRPDGRQTGNDRSGWEPAVAAFSSKPEENEVFRSVTPIRTTTTLHDFLSMRVTTREAVPLPRGAPSVPLRRTQDLAGYGSRQRL